MAEWKGDTLLTCKTERFRRFESFCFRKLEVWQSWSIARAVKRSKGSNPLASSDGTLADLVYAQD